MLIVVFYSCSNESVNSVYNETKTINFDKCYRVVQMNSNSLICNDKPSITVVLNTVFMSGVQPSSFDKTIVCLSDEYGLNSFSMGQLICDYTKYEH